MSSSLLKERNDFLKRASALPAVERRATQPAAKRQKVAPSPKVTGRATSGQKNFAAIHKIVNHMKSLHLSGETRQLTLTEILEECHSQTLVTSSQRANIEEALKSNIKLKTVEVGGVFRFCFRPPLEGVKDKKSFLRFLEAHYMAGLGGITKEHVLESVPRAEKVIKHHEEKKNIVVHTRPDKKVVIFYNDRSCDIEIDETFQKMWRSVPVASIDEDKIQDYLEKQGITSVDDPGIRKIIQPAKKRRNNKKRRFKTHNDHVSNLLDYN